MRSRLLALALVGVAVGGSSCKAKDGGASAAPASASASAGAPASASAPSGAGGTFEGAIIMQTSSEHRPPTELTMLAKGDKVRIDIPSHNGQTAHSILDPDKKQILVVIDAQKMAMTMALPATPPAPSSQAAPTITKTGKHETIAGHDCEDWNVVESSGKHTQLCMADGVAFFDFTSIAPPGSNASPFGSWLEDLRDKKEFPLRAVTTDATGKEESRMEVVKIDARTLEDALFTVPDGYRMMAMPAGMAGVGGTPGAGGPPAMGGMHPTHH